MVKQFLSIEEKQDDHEVRVSISANCPIGFAHDALFKVRCFIIEQMNASLKQDAPKQEEKPKQE